MRLYMFWCAILSMQLISASLQEGYKDLHKSEDFYYKEFERDGFPPLKLRCYPHVDGAKFGPWHHVHLPSYDNYTHQRLTNKEDVEEIIHLDDYQKVQAIIAGQITAETKFPVRITCYYRFGYCEIEKVRHFEWVTAKEKADLDHKAWYAALPCIQKIGYCIGCIRK